MVAAAGPAIQLAQSITFRPAKRALGHSSFLLVILHFYGPGCSGPSAAGSYKDNGICMEIALSAVNHASAPSAAPARCAAFLNLERSR